MRVLGVVAVSLFALSASAETPTSLPFEVVSLLPKTQQVLVYDRAHNTHVLLAPGAKFEDITVLSISGVGISVEKAQERFTVYPKAARGLTVELEPNKNNPPHIYSSTPASPTQVATTPAVAGASVAGATAGAAAGATVRPAAKPRTERGPSVAKLKP